MTLPLTDIPGLAHPIRSSSRASLLEESSAKDSLRVELEKSVRQAEILRETLVEKEKDYQVLLAGKVLYLRFNWITYSHVGAPAKTTTHRERNRKNQQP